MTMDLSRAVREAAKPLTGASSDYDELLGAIGDARFVLIGEASHGTHEFYNERARITRALIEQKGFTAVAVEADWPDAYRVNRYVRGRSDDASALDALGDFQRFPKWMWRNEDVQKFTDWLREHNERIGDERGAGFYGIDLYSLHRSMEAVVAYLEKVDPQAAARARHRYSCFEDFGAEGQAYGYATSVGANEPCEDQVVEQLQELQRRGAERAAGGMLAADEQFFAEQNALVARNAEQYYRSMFRGRASSWNLRDTHMYQTVRALAQHIERQGQEAKIVVWAHNSHLGDASATEMGWSNGELNVGQLIRENHRAETFNIGFSTHSGTVTASDDWDTPARRKTVRPGLKGSYEDLLHGVGMERYWLNLREQSDAVAGLGEQRLQRAIGVIYRPETERWSHYFHARLPEQFDAMIHLDVTSAVVPLDWAAGWEERDAPDTYPRGL